VSRVDLLRLQNIASFTEYKREEKVYQYMPIHLSPQSGNYIPDESVQNITILSECTAAYMYVQICNS